MQQLLMMPETITAQLISHHYLLRNDKSFKNSPSRVLIVNVSSIEIENFFAVLFNMTAEKIRDKSE